MGQAVCGSESGHAGAPGKRPRALGKPPRPNMVDVNEIGDMSLIPGIGKGRADDISKLLDGSPLMSLLDLKEVSGIGEKTLAKIGRHAFVDPGFMVSKGAGVDHWNTEAEFRKKCSTLMIGSWNVRNLGRAAMETGRAEGVARIIAAYDVLALVELRDAEIVEGLLSILGTEVWSATVSPQVGTAHHKEIYAFFYRKAAVEMLREELLPDPIDEWVREPFLTYFRAPAGFDFAIASIHVVWGETVAERRREVEALAKVIPKIRDWAKDEDVLIVGDFNVDPDDKSWAEIREAGFTPLLEGEGVISMVKGHHCYDNIWANKKKTLGGEWLGASGIIRFDELLFGEDEDKEAIKAISDHRPIWSIFAADVDEDED